jgi:hypothetical protein
MKKIGIIVLLVFIAIQFIRPQKIQSIGVDKDDIVFTTGVPKETWQNIQRACYDCHSNKPNYPWYFNIQPIGWWINNHMEEGRHHLNFSEFNSYKLGRKRHKLEEVAESVTDHWMPLSSYLWIHKNARLSDKELKDIADWANMERSMLPPPDKEELEWLEKKKKKNKN